MRKLRKRNCPKLKFRFMRNFRKKIFPVLRKLRKTAQNSLQILRENSANFAQKIRPFRGNPRTNHIWAAAQFLQIRTQLYIWLNFFVLFYNEHKEKMFTIEIENERETPWKPSLFKTLWNICKIFLCNIPRETKSLNFDLFFNSFNVKSIHIKRK